jgi:hypothetical protein
LNELKKDNPALWNPGFGGEMVELETDNKNHILAFSRVKGENQVYFMLNLSPQEVEFNMTGVNEAEVFTDFETGATVTLENAALILDGWDYKILYR